MNRLLSPALGALVLIAASAALADRTPEFEGHCAMSVASGNSLPTDCSVVWISPKTSKLYCFSSENAKAVFVRNASSNEDRAQAFWKDPSFWEKLQRERGDGQPEG
jgi:hypothetical protein